MPRPTRAQGRPGTRIFPKDFEASHGVVVGKAATATVLIFPPPAGTGATMNADFTYATPDPATAIYGSQDSGPNARIQVLGAQESAALAVDQEVVTVGYLVVIDRNADIPLDAVVQITASSDTTLLGDRRLVVRKIARGSVRWERDLWCVDTLNTPT